MSHAYTYKMRVKPNSMCSFNIRRHHNANNNFKLLDWKKKIERRIH